MSHFAVALNCLLLLTADSPELKVVTEYNVAVPMRDGVVLRANVFDPTAEAPIPSWSCALPTENATADSTAT